MKKGFEGIFCFLEFMKKNIYRKVPLGGTILGAKNRDRKAEMKARTTKNAEPRDKRLFSQIIMQEKIFMMQKMVPLRGVAIQKPL